jgi:ribonuclease HIII
LTFQNSQYNYQNESFWISKETKLELHNFLIKEIEKKHKFKNFEIILDNNIVLVVSFNKKKISFNLWDGYTWIQSYWYRKFKVNNLFGG